MAPELLDTSRIRKLLFLGPRGSYSDLQKIHLLILSILIV